MGEVLRLGDHPILRARERARLEGIAARVLALLDDGDERAIHRILTPLSAKDLSQVTALLMA